MNLYRRYRPLCLKDVIGQDQITASLENSIKEGRISHAYLFVGPRGCGKTSVARILAHEINGFKYEIEDDYVDIIEIDGASNRGIDSIRELREKVLIAPTTGKYKVYIIDEVHMLTKEAFNALLKTLEEPPKHVVFIMATTDAYKVPVTITSRAQTYTFKLATEEVMFPYLKSIAEKEKITITDDALRIIVKRGGGSFRDSLSLLDQVSTLSHDEITKELVVSAMGLPSDEKITELLLAYLSSDLDGITTTLKELLISGIKPETLAEELIGEIVNSPKPELLDLLGKLPEVKAPFPEAKLLVALAPKGVKTSLANKLVDNSTVPVKKIMKTEVTTAIANEESPNMDFNWDGFLDKVHEKNEVIYSQLKKVTYRFSGNTLDIFPSKRIVKTILSRENNKRVLVDLMGNVKITIHDVEDAPVESAKDQVLAKLSAIMGGEVQNDAGGNPFK